MSLFRSPFRGVLSPSVLPSIGAVGGGQGPIRGALNAVLPSITFAGEAGAVAANNAALDANLPSITFAGAGFRVIGGALAAVSPAATFAGGAEIVSTLVLDTFTGANGTEITSRPPDIDVVGTGWDAEAGFDDNFTIQSNRATSDLSSFRNAWIDVGVQDKTVSAVVNASADAGAGGNPGIWVNYDGGTNQLLIDFDVDGTFRIQETVGGSTTTRASGSITFNTATDYNIVVIRAGSNVSADWDDGTETLNYGSVNAAITSTLCGLRINNDAVFDDFTVTG